LFDGDTKLTEEEIEIVAEELAKIGGTSWYPGREEGSLVRVVSQRYRDRARIAIAALERYRAGRDLPDGKRPGSPTAPNLARRSVATDDPLAVGAVVIYRPAGDRRAYACRIEDIADGKVYLVPDIKACTGWVSMASLAVVPNDSSPKE
jgi:hypothetical protein